MTAEMKNDLCPDCGRQKAYSADDAVKGFCDKWYAVRDPDAAAECYEVRSEKMLIVGSIIAHNYMAGMMMSEDGGGVIKLRYSGVESAERAFDAITEAIDLANKHKEKSC